MTKPAQVATWGSESAAFTLEGGYAVLPNHGHCAVQDRLWSFADRRQGFYGWLSTVNQRCLAIDGMHLLDLPSRGWRGEYDGRVPPDEAADVALDEFASLHGVTRS